MTYLIRRNPANINKSMERFYNSFFQPLNDFYAADRNGPTSLAMDVYQTEDNLVIEAMLPGFSPENVDITIEHNVLTVKAQSTVNEETKNDAVYHLRENHGYRHLERSITLPTKVNADDTEAIFKNGVLTLTIPKAEEAKPRRINVTTN